MILILAIPIYALYNSFLIYNTGKIKTINIGVYKEYECSEILSHIDWGVIEPNQKLNYTIFVKNEANTEITLKLNITNFIPEIASNYIELTWDYEGQTLLINEIKQITLTLYAMAESDKNIKDFSFDIIVIGEG